MKKLQVGTAFLYTDETHGFNLDGILLSAFASERHAGLAADLCCGSGIVALGLVLRKGADRVVGLERNEQAVELFRKSIVESGLSDKLCCVAGDVNQAEQHLVAPFDVVVCNPPFRPAGAAKHSPNTARAAARGEVTLTLSVVCRAAGALLKEGGRFALCQRPARLVDCMQAMRANGLEPKRMRLCAYDKKKAPWLVLLEGVKGGGTQLDVAPTFYVKQAGEDSAEYQKLFEEVGACPEPSIS